MAYYMCAYPYRAAMYHRILAANKTEAIRKFVHGTTYKQSDIKRVIRVDGNKAPKTAKRVKKEWKWANRAKRRGER